MKSKIYASLAFVLCVAANNLTAQNTFPATGRVGIGTTSPNASALLEIKSTSKGLLVPRMTKAQRDAIGGPATSLLIYQTDNTPGFYYYAGSSWKAVTPATSNAWLLTGNGGTASTAFLGTTDAKPIIFKTNNVEAMRLSSAGNLGIGMTSGATSRFQVDGGSGVSLSSPGYAIIGKVSSYNIAMDYYQIQARYNGTYSTLYLNNYGGTTYAGNTSNSSYGLIGYGVSYGLYGYASNSSGTGVYGNSYYGLYGSGTYGVYASGTSYGIRTSSSSGYGAYATSTSSDGIYASSTNSHGVHAYSSANTGLYASTGTGTGSGYYAAYFAGDVMCSGNYLGSDEKLKQNITNVTSAMDIINKLQPKFYDYKHDGNLKFMNLPQGKHYGLIAQDVEKVLPNLVKTSKFNTADAIADEMNEAAPADSAARVAFDKKMASRKITGEEVNFKAVNYTELIPILIKGMQEQEQEIDLLRRQVQELSGNTSLSANTNSTDAVKSINLTSASLLQNIPNPLKNNTSIQYNLPDKFSKAQIVITDNNGKTLKQVNVSGAGKGSVKVDASLLSSGTYNYSLIVDGRTIESKKMIVSK